MYENIDCSLRDAGLQCKDYANKFQDEVSMLKEEVVTCKKNITTKVEGWLKRKK